MNDFSFQKGWYDIPQGKVSGARKKFMSLLGLTTKQGFKNRLNGDVAHTPAERAAIEKIFAEYGITDVWGAV